MYSSQSTSNKLTNNDKRSIAHEIFRRYKYKINESRHSYIFLMSLKCTMDSEWYKFKNKDNLKTNKELVIVKCYGNISLSSAQDILFLGM